MGLTPETLMQLGLYDYVWGDNWYPKAMQAAEEAEKNREAQRAYNDYLKEYDRAKAEAEKSAAYKKELKEAEVEMAALNRDLVKANAPEAAVIAKRQEALMTKYPELKSSNEEALAKQKEEEEYQSKKIGVRSAIPTVFADENAINAQIAKVMASDLRPQDKEELVKELQSKKSTAQLAREASQSAVASHAGKKTGESLDEADLAASTIKKITAGKGPSSMSDAERNKAKELGYRFRQGKWSK
jgi:hypothetical protein